MGFKVQRTVYRLVFEDDLEGLVVSAYAPPLGFFEKAMKMAPLVGKRADQLSPEEAALVMEFFGGFAEYLVEWNLENDDDTPVSATADGLLSQDMGFVMRIVMAWLNAVGEAGVPLPQPSSSGKPSLEGSLPMEPLSASPQSSTGPSSSSGTASDSGASLVS